MVDLLPSTPDTSAAEEPDPRVVGLDDDEAGDVIAALSSATAREVFAALHEDPDTPSGIADRVDTTLQNAQYHLGRMDDAGLLEVVDTVYSEKGREMDVYAPADRPLVMFAGSDDETEGLRAALSRLLGAVGLLAVGSLVVEYLLRDGPWLSLLGGAGSSAAPSGGAGGDATVTARAVEAADAAGTSSLGLPPGVVFFLGGLAALLAAVGVRYLGSRRS